jgi:hypothetical protein
MAALSVDDLDRFCRRRVVDLVWRAGDSRRPLVLHGEFDGYGDFFSIWLGDIEYVSLANGFVVGGMTLGSFGDFCASEPQWRGLRQYYSGPALVFTADGRDVGAPGETGEIVKFVVVANVIECVAGRDWDDNL